MKEKKFYCKTITRDSVTVALCEDNDRVSVWWSTDAGLSVHLSPDDAIKMGERLIRAAIKQKAKYA